MNQEIKRGGVRCIERGHRILWLNLFTDDSSLNCDDAYLVVFHLI